MSSLEQSAKPGIKIEAPEQVDEPISFFYYFLVLLSLVLVSLTLWFLISEWSGTALPSFLRHQTAG